MVAVAAVLATVGTAVASRGEGVAGTIWATAVGVDTVAAGGALPDGIPVVLHPAIVRAHPKAQTDASDHFFMILVYIDRRFSS
jgi:hypothetical protein